MVRKAMFVPLGWVACTLMAQPIPPRPEALVYKPLTYQPPVAQEHKVVLKNGIPVYLVPDATTGLVRIGVNFRGGAYLEPDAKPGLANLMGSQWRAGGTLKTKADDLDERLDFLAANLFSFAGNTTAALRLQVLDKDLKEGMALLQEVMLEPAFAQDRLDLAKKSIRQELETRNDSVGAIVSYQIRPLLSGDRHFTARQITASALDAITREDLQAFHARLLHPANMVISVAGRFDRKAMVTLLNQTFGALKPQAKAQKSPGVPAPTHTRKPGIYFSHKPVPQSLLIMALPGLRRSDPDWFPCLVMNEILGGGTQAARLMKKLRSDEGLTYGVYSRFTEGPHYQGDWILQIQTKNRSVPYATRLILEQMNRLREEPVSDDDLKVVQGILVDGFPNQFENANAVAAGFASEAMDGWPEGYTSTFRQKVQAVTKADIQRVAKKYLDPAKLMIIAAGNRDEAMAGDEKDHPGLLKDVLPLPVVNLPLRDPLTLLPKAEESQSAS